MTLPSRLVIDLVRGPTGTLGGCAAQEGRSRLVVVSVDSRVVRQLSVGGVIDITGPGSVVVGDERVGRS